MPESDGLRMVVCIKQVPKAEQLQIDPVKKTLIREGVESEINPSDLHALEMALQLKDKHGGSVFALSMGPPRFIQALETAISMGADEGILLSDRALAGSDTLPTSYALSKAIQHLGGFDIVFCGEETTDSSTGHVGPGIAANLDIPQLTYVVEVGVRDDHVRAKRAVEDGFEVWETRLPVVITVNHGCNRPREPTLLGKIRARTIGVLRDFTAEDVGLDKERIGLSGSPTVVSKIETVELPERSGRIYSGEVKEAVRKLLDDLEMEGLI
ncbi:MAG: electron transfer flavoprotein subunit beta/FixA family protein [Thermoplasmata archaeon]